MNYIKPEEVVSPKGRVSNIRVLVEDKYYSIVRLEWDGKNRLATRWNNDSIGTPQSRGLPTWFILPEEIELPYMEKYMKEEELKEKIIKFFDEK